MRFCVHPAPVRPVETLIARNGDGSAVKLRSGQVKIRGNTIEFTQIGIPQIHEGASCSRW